MCEHGKSSKFTFCPKKRFANEHGSRNTLLPIILCGTPIYYNMTCISEILLPRCVLL